MECETITAQVLFSLQLFTFAEYNVSVNEFLKSANTSQKVYYFGNQMRFLLTISGPITWWPELANQMEGVEKLHLHLADQGEYKSETRYHSISPFA